MLPSADYSPEKIALPTVPWGEWLIKRPIRRFAYPLYNALMSRWLRHRYGDLGLEADQWLWGQRGNDFERQRSRVNHFLPLRGKDIVVAGCGTGRDVPSWLTFHPGTLTGVDYFSYARMWSMLTQHFHAQYPTNRVEFCQADLTAIDQLSDASVDVIGSDAVFEHVRDLPAVLKEFHRILHPGGVVYATYGPLWHCWGGDHISGADQLHHGYNHLLLAREDYEKYLDGLGEYTHSEHDGRTWIKHGLFSYLRPLQYLQLLEAAGFGRLFVGAIIEPRAIQCLAERPDLRAQLVLENSSLDLIVTGMTIIYQKRFV